MYKSFFNITIRSADPVVENHLNASLAATALFVNNGNGKNLFFELIVFENLKFF